MSATISLVDAKGSTSVWRIDKTSESFAYNMSGSENLVYDSSNRTVSFSHLRASGVTGQNTTFLDPAYHTKISIDLMHGGATSVHVAMTPFAAVPPQPPTARRSAAASLGDANPNPRPTKRKRTASVSAPSTPMPDDASAAMPDAVSTGGGAVSQDEAALAAAAAAARRRKQQREKREAKKAEALLAAAQAAAQTGGDDGDDAVPPQPKSGRTKKPKPPATVVAQDMPALPGDGDGGDVFNTEEPMMDFGDYGDDA